MNGDRYVVLPIEPDGEPTRTATALAELDELVAGSADAGRSGRSVPHSVVTSRLVDDHLWWSACADAVTAAPERLLSWYTGTDQAALAIVELHSPNAVAAAKVVAGLGLALHAGARGVLDEAAHDALRRAIDYWPGANAMVKGPMRSGVYVPLGWGTPGLDAVVAELDTLAGGPVRTLVALQAALLGGADPVLRHRRQVQVLFEIDGRELAGATGTVTTAILPGGPSGLFPDPRTMSFFRADEAFADALTQAWRHATRHTSDPPCVLWTLTNHDQPHRVVRGGSLGAPLAVALGETITARSRPWSPGLLLRTVPAQCAVTGTVDADGTIGSVGGLDGKLAAARPRRWRVVAPAANKSETQRKAPDGVHVSWASTVAGARRQVRRWRPMRTTVAAVVAAALVAVGGIALVTNDVLAGYRSTAEQQRRVSAAHSLALRAELIRDRQYTDALRLGAAALEIHDSPESRAGLVTTLLSVHRTGTVTGFPLAVRSVANSADKRTLLTVDHRGEDRHNEGPGNASLWTIADPGRPLRLSELDSGHPARSAALSPNGRLALIGLAGDAGAALWDLKNPRSPRRTATFDHGGPRGVGAVAFLDGGRLALLGHTCGSASLWSLADRAHPRRIAHLIGSGSCPTMADERDPRPPPAALAVTPNGQAVLFANGSENGNAVVWDIENRARPRRLATLDGHRGITTAVAFRADGRVAATGGHDRTVVLWGIEDPTRPYRLTTLQGNAGAVNLVAFSPDNRTMLTAGVDGGVHLWDASNPSRARLSISLGGHAGSVDTAAISTDGTMAVTGGVDRAAAVWDLADRGAPRQMGTARAGAALTAMAVNDNADIAITGSADGKAVLWDLTDPRQPTALRALSRLHAPNDPAGLLPPTIPAVAMSPDGNHALTPGPPPTVVVWGLADRTSPRAVATLPGHDKPLTAMAIAPDGRTALTGATDGIALLWRIRADGTPELPVSLPGEAAAPDAPVRPVVSASYDTTGRTVLVGRGDGTVAIWDVTRPAEPRRKGLIATRTATVGSVAYSPDGRTVLTSGLGDWAGELWDITDPSTPKPAGALSAYSDAIAASTFSASGAALLSGSYDGTAVLWNVIDPSRPRRLTVLTGGNSPARLVALSGDNRTAVIGSDDGSLVVADLSAAAAIIADPLTHACDATGGGLDQKQWSHYVPNLPFQEICAP